MTWRDTLRERRHDKRRMRLFTAACLREMLRLTAGERYLPVVELIERHADSPVTAEEIEAICREFGAMYRVWFLEVGAYCVALHAGSLLEKAREVNRWGGWFAPGEEVTC
jgi:hypothetical protein